MLVISSTQNLGTDNYNEARIDLENWVQPGLYEVDNFTVENKFPNVYTPNPSHFEVNSTPIALSEGLYSSSDLVTEITSAINTATPGILTSVTYNDITNKFIITFIGAQTFEVKDERFAIVTGFTNRLNDPSTATIMTSNISNINNLNSIFVRVKEDSLRYIHGPKNARFSFKFNQGTSETINHNPKDIQSRQLIRFTSSFRYLTFTFFDQLDNIITQHPIHWLLSLTRVSGE